MKTKFVAACLVLWIQDADRVALIPQEHRVHGERDLEEYSQHNGVSGGMYRQGDAGGQQENQTTASKVLFQLYSCITWKY